MIKPQRTIKPCAEFKRLRPGRGGYRAYCGRCLFSEKAHLMWDEWTKAAEQKSDQ